MLKLSMAGAMALMAGQAFAQTVPLNSPPKTEAAPWWINASVIPQLGYATRDATANRAEFSASFLSVAKTVEGAQQKAKSQIEPLTLALRGLDADADAVKVTTALTVRALYKQYRTKDGQKLEDQRGDRIESYQVISSLRVHVRDLSQLERAYALVMAANPTSSQPVYFSLKSENETKSALMVAAFTDARQRAEVAAIVLGRKLGPVKLIDATGRACSTDILGRTPEGDNNEAEGVVVVTGSKRSAYAREMSPPPPPPPLEMLEAKATDNTFIQDPPIITKQAQACVVYGLN
jgi:uncharacterized protein